MAVVPKGAGGPEYGVIEGEAQTDTNIEKRTVKMYDKKIEVRFPDLPDVQAAQLETMVKDALPNRKSLTISLDRVLAYVEDSEKPEPTVKVNLDPPPIYYSDKPAILVNFVGQPDFKSIEGTTLTYAVNTNWDVFQDLRTSHYYLLNDKIWLTTSDPVRGPWTLATSLPPDLDHLPAKASWDDVRSAIPLVPGKDAAPSVVVSEQPAEIIVTDGAAKFTTIPGTSLMYVTNSDSTIFFHSQEQNFYFLVAGRWFRGKSLNGPWTAATTNLPPDFSKIPDDSPVDYVRRSVPGTDDANDAVLIASIPVRATVNRQDVTVTVVYDGPPKFAPIEGTALQYAINTANDVILANGIYYCCFQGVWFQSATPEGPWVVCDAVPKEIYQIPSTSPVYNVTYVNIYASTPSTVEVGYTGGYTGQYVAGGVVMFGAGVAVSAIIANNSDAVYAGRYRVNSAYYSYGAGAVYNGSTGGYYRGAAVSGPAGSAFARQSYNPQTGISAGQIGGSNQYGSWSRGVATRGDNTISGGRNSNARGTVGWAESSNGRAVAGAKGNGGASAAVGNRGGAAIKTSNGDIYAGRDGNVYSRQDGQWQSNTGAGRTAPNRTATPGARACTSGAGGGARPDKSPPT